MIGEEGAAWLIERATALGQAFGEIEPDQTVSLFAQRNVIVVRVGRRKLGKLSQSVVEQRDEDALVGLFRLARVTMIRVVPPDDMEWNEFAASLWAARWATTRMLNRITEHLFAALYQGDQRAASSIAYSLVSDKTGIVPNEIRDEALAEVKKLERKVRDSKGDEKRQATLKGHMERWQQRAAAVAFSGAVRSVISRVAADELAKKGRTNPFKENGPVFLRNDSFRISERVKPPSPDAEQENDNEKSKKKKAASEKEWALDFCIAGGTGKWQTGILVPMSGTEKSTLRRIVSGDYDAADAKLVFNERHRRWMIAITYRIPRETPLPSAGPIFIRRGFSDICYGLPLEGASKVVAFGDGWKLIRWKQQYDRRRNELKRGLNKQGRGAHGHGRARFYRRYRYLQRKDANNTRTFCGQLASEIIKYCQEHRYEILLEDFSGPFNASRIADPYFSRLMKRFPFSMPEKALLDQASECGIRVRKVQAEYDAQTCPDCGKVDKANHQPDKQQFTCVACGFELRDDYVAGWNGLKKAGFDVTEIAASGKRVAAAIKAAKTRRKANEQ